MSILNTLRMHGRFRMLSDSCLIYSHSSQWVTDGLSLTSVLDRLVISSL
jgi:hypothetical protein